MAQTWAVLDDAEREAIWDRFYARFDFRASMTNFPGFAEPADSTTFSLSAMYGDEDRYWQIRRGCEAAFLAAARSAVPADGHLYALDWQHPAYRFWPHGPVETDHLGDWTVPFLPNGDYYCFVDPDLRFGTLGHPWEETLCLFGAPFSTALAGALIDLLGMPIRRGGKAVREAPSRRGKR
jgi:hypothetical protein